MAEDYYKDLGVSKTASADEIQKAYRKLARKYHPDLHADKDEKEKEQAKQKFQKVQQAYDVLSDPEKREMYDQFGPNFAQMGGASGPFGGGAGGPFGAGGGGQYADIDFSQIFGGGGQRGGGGFEDILRQMGGGWSSGTKSGTRGRGGPQTKAAPKAADLEQEITIPFAVAVLGGKHNLSITRPNGKVDSIEVTIPAGIEQSKKIRLKGQGHANGRARGDLMIKVNIAPHPSYTRQGLNLGVTIPISLKEAVEGAKIDLPTPHGTVTLSVPAGSSSGKSLRLKEMGIQRKDRKGDLIATLQIRIPEQVSEGDLELINQLSDSWIENSRNKLSW